MWNVGDRLNHRYNPDLGPGRVIGFRARHLLVEFPESAQTLRFAADSDALVPLVLAPASRARLETTGETVTVESCDAGCCRLTDGREVSIQDLWPLPTAVSPIDALTRGTIGSFQDFANRLDALRLSRLREADGLGSFLGGRIHLFPHQLYTAERACRSEVSEGAPVRWLLADEVGLGKTVEACLIMNRLIHTSRAERTLVVAPETLTVQWLGELWRKYHQVFVLLDEKRLKDIIRDYGEGFNPFDVHRRAIISLERLTSDRRLTEQAVEAGIDLLVVDEAHHLRRARRHPGNAEYRAVAPIAALGRNVLLLTATPLEDDAHGFFRLLQLLRPEELPETGSFDARLRKRAPLPPCTSATRRIDIGGLPPRVPVPVEIDDDEGWLALRRLEERMRARRAANAAQRRRKAELVTRALASPAALRAVAERNDPETAELIAAAEASDPRVRWLAERAHGWRQGEEKTLVFVAHRETLEALREALERQGRVQVGIFHEDLSAERRDIEVAQFRLSGGPALLISTECGGEGRNFEFCQRLVLFDLPWNPTVVEQRIGRLDRIGRTLPTEIVYFRPPSGFGRTLVGLYEAIKLFSAPLGGLARELNHVAREVAKVATEGVDEVDPAVFEAVLHEAREAHTRIREAAYHELHRDRFEQPMAEAILARVPPELDALTEDVVVRAAARFGFTVEEVTEKIWLIEFGSESLVDHLPGVTAGSRFLGTFDRELAVENETIDYFASGHPLIEGILAELEEGDRGRMALLQAAGAEEVFGLLAIYKSGPAFEVVAVDGKGQLRPDLAERLTAQNLESEHVKVDRWTRQATWGKAIRRLAESLPDEEMPQAVAAFRIRREEEEGAPAATPR
ncbi:MAG: DEAD/DEAH box helicase family protein, partial [bacterium]|nr:DEAD/DEAH box helicase family protein [bacterium]